MSLSNSIYIQVKSPIIIEKTKEVFVKDLVDIVAHKDIKSKILNLKVFDIGYIKEEYMLVSIMSVIDKIYKVYPELDINIVGENEILLKVDMKKKKNRFLEIIKVFLVCSILFFGAALAINQFHADVNMAKAHSQIYKLITGKENEKPLLLQISYSIGLGIGMIAFFFKISCKKSDEPNPLDMELYLYEQNIERYILDKEKKKS